MKKIILCLFLLSSHSSFAESLNATEQKEIQDIINLFKKNDQNAITNSIRYPLMREEPIPSIDNKAQMKQRFNQVFDQKLVKNIANSKLSQWQSMGWRGIMLDSGTIWVSDKQITAVKLNNFINNNLSPLKNKNYIHHSKHLKHLNYNLKRQNFRFVSTK